MELYQRPSLFRSGLAGGNQRWAVTSQLRPLRGPLHRAMDNYNGYHNPDVRLGKNKQQENVTMV